MTTPDDGTVSAQLLFLYLLLLIFIISIVGIAG